MSATYAGRSFPILGEDGQTAASVSSTHCAKLAVMKVNNQIRIGAGAWRSRIVRFPDALGLRPTPDRVRATVFNWLGQTLHGKVCLDAFAGSGALGFEAASRGADEVTLCETDARAVQALRDNARLLQATNCKIVDSDVFSWLKKNPARFDVVFCDPPFVGRLHLPFLQAIAAHLTPGGVVYIETGEPLDPLVVTAVGYDVLKSSQAGAVYFGLLRPKTSG